jgi:hypothetical protein
MKIELRKVRPDWQHPTDAEGGFIPLLGGLAAAVAAWDEEAGQWERGFIRGIPGEEPWVARDMSDPAEGGRFEEFFGPRPDPKDYMPDWPAQECTAWQYYEAGSEGTPISPVMTKLLPLGNKALEREVNLALHSDDPLLVNDMACQLAHLVHFETLHHDFLAGDRSQENIRSHASALVHLMLRQSELLKRSDAK